MPPRLFIAPGNADPDTRHNWLAAQKEAISFAPTEAVSSFLPILLARLGASSLQVGLVSTIPNLAGFLLAIPIGHFLQGRRRVMPFYSRGRFIGQLGLAAIGFTLVLLPDARAIPVILAILACATVVGSFANFSFYVVMDGLSGPSGRYELMGRRWGMKAAATALSLPIIGLILGELAFPQSYQLVLIATAIPAAIAFGYMRTFRIPDQVPGEPSEKLAPLVRARSFVEEVVHERRCAGNFAGMTGPLLGAVLATSVGIPMGLAAASAVALLGAGLFAVSVLAGRRAAERERGPVRPAPTA